MTPALTEALHYHDPKARGFASMLIEGKQSTFLLSSLPDVLERLPPDIDAYLSEGEFYRPNRQLVNFVRIGLSFIDCDTYKTEYGNLTAEHQARAFLLYCEDSGTPRPSLINHSGRGIHPKWIYDAPLPADALPRFNAVQKALCDRLTPFAADKGAKDASRLLRIVGTVNSRNGQTARTVWQEETNGHLLRWDFEEISREVLPLTRAELQIEKKAREAVREAQNREGGYRWSPGHLWWLRLQDLQTLLRLRGWDGDEGVPEGYRHNVLFVGACAICWSKMAVNWRAEIIELANRFCPTLPAIEVRSLADSAIRSTQEKRDRRMSSQYIIDLLDIGKSERTFLKTLIPDDERDARRKEADCLSKRKFSPRSEFLANAADRRETAFSLRCEGFSIREISKILFCSVPAVKSLLRQRNAGAENSP